MTHFKVVCLLNIILCIHLTVGDVEFEGGSIVWTENGILQVPIETNQVPDEPDESVDLKPKLSSKQIYANLKKRIESIGKSCGQVCQTDMKGEPGKYYPAIRKEVDCKALFTNTDIDAASEFNSPPAKIPKYLFPEFTYNDQLKLKEHYRNDAEGISHKLDWDEQLFQTIQTMYDEGILRGPYGISTVENIKRHLDDHVEVKDKNVLVIGSQSPWIEAILLNKGAKNITTFDYVKIKNTHPQIEVLMPEELSEKFLNTKTRYDVMISFSSVEHSGLGRYGDMLNPWGDLITMARAWCLVKPGGKALVGVPSGPDTIIFNSHRLYGPVAYSHLFANWNQIYTENDFAEYNKFGCDHCYQPLHVIERSLD